MFGCMLLSDNTNASSYRDRRDIHVGKAFKMDKKVKDGVILYYSFCSITHIFVLFNDYEYIRTYKGYEK